MVGVIYFITFHYFFYFFFINLKFINLNFFIDFYIIHLFIDSFPFSTFLLDSAHYLNVNDFTSNFKRAGSPVNVDIFLFEREFFV